MNKDLRLDIVEYARQLYKETDAHRPDTALLAAILLVLLDQKADIDAEEATGAKPDSKRS